MLTKAKDRSELIKQIDEFFASGKEVHQLGNTELKTQRFLVNSKEPVSTKKLKPSFKRG